MVVIRERGQLNVSEWEEIPPALVVGRSPLIVIITQRGNKMNGTLSFSSFHSFLYCADLA